jgi:hypothetical protein
MQAETATVVKLEEGLELKSWGLEIANCKITLI